MRWGLFGKDNDKGLGTLTREYIEYLSPDKVYIMEDDRTLHSISGAVYRRDLSALPDFLDTLDVVVLLETPHQAVIRQARQRGIRSIVKVNYEFLPAELHNKPDLFLCSSSLNYGQVHYENKILIPDPVDTSRFRYKQRRKVRTVLHNAGTLGIGGANGTMELLEAMKYTTTPIHLIVNSQVPIPEARNTTVRVKSYEDNADMFSEGEVFVSPQKFRATSLPTQEAMASGMPVLATDIQPFNEFCQFLFPSSGSTKEFLSRPIDVAIIDPKVLAKALDNLYGKDVSEASKKARRYAQSISWRALQKEYLKVI